MIENNETEKKSGITAIIIGIVVFFCCICLLVAGMAGYGYYAFTQIAANDMSHSRYPSLFDTVTPVACN